MFETTMNALEQTAKPAAYSISGFLAVGGFLQFINQWAAVIGVGLGILTYLTNLFFQIRRYRRGRK